MKIEAMIKIRRLLAELVQEDKLDMKEGALLMQVLDRLAIHPEVCSKCISPQKHPSTLLEATKLSTPDFIPVCQWVA